MESSKGTSPVIEGQAEGGGSAPAERSGLKTGAIGWMGAAVLGAVFLSPALGLYGNIGPIIGTAGNVAPAVWLVAGTLAMLNATNYAMVSRRMPSAGSAFTWSWNALNPRVGTWVGWMMLGYYVAVSITLPLLFGLFFNATLGEIGAGTGYWSWAIGVVACSAAVAAAVYRNIEMSTRTALIFLLIEAAVVIGLCVTLLIEHPAGPLTLQPFNPGNATGGTSAYFLALVFGIFAYTGFETVSVVAEETQAPKDKVPQATIVAVLLVICFWIFATYALSFALPVGKVLAAVEGDVTPVASMAAAVWGSGSVVVDITGMTAAFAVFLAAAVATSRTVFAQARGGTLPRVFRRVDPITKVPTAALNAFFAVSVICTLVGAKIVGIIDFYTWTVNAVIFFALIMYSATAVANLLIHRGESGRSHLATVLVPITAVALNAYLLYKFYFDVLWNSGFALGRSVTFACLGIALLAAIAIAVLHVRRPEMFEGRSFVLGDTEDGAA
jgi:amino acid transporter